MVTLRERLGMTPFSNFLLGIMSLLAPCFCLKIKIVFLLSFFFHLKPSQYLLKSAIVIPMRDSAIEFANMTSTHSYYFLKWIVFLLFVNVDLIFLFLFQCWDSLFFFLLKPDQIKNSRNFNPWQCKLWFVLTQTTNWAVMALSFMAWKDLGRSLQAQIERRVGHGVRKLECEWP